jgi:hypothetical protein
MMEEAAEEVDMLATDIEGRLTDKNIEASWKAGSCSQLCVFLYFPKETVGQGSQD